MRRTLNFTGRQLIPEETLRFETGEDASQDFDLELDFSDMGLPASAQIYVEAYYRTDLMRFNWGTVGTTDPSSDRTLEEFADVRAVRFRVKVVDADSDLGRILARREGIRPGAEQADGAEGEDGEREKKDSLLPVAFVDLGDELWRLSLNPAPTLELNNQDEGVEREFRYNPQFRSLVLPQVLRDVLTHILVVDPLPLDEIRQAGGWESKWLRFAEGHHGDAPPEDADGEIQERRRWIDAAVARFSGEHGFLGSFLESK